MFIANSNEAICFGGWMGIVCRARTLAIASVLLTIFVTETGIAEVRQPFPQSAFNLSPQPSSRYRRCSHCGKWILKRNPPTSPKSVFTNPNSPWVPSDVVSQSARQSQNNDLATPNSPSIPRTVSSGTRGAHGVAIPVARAVANDTTKLVTKSFHPFAECPSSRPHKKTFSVGEPDYRICPDWFGITLKVANYKTTPDRISYFKDGGQFIAMGNQETKLAIHNSESGIDFPLDPEKLLPGFSARLGSFNIALPSDPVFITEKDESGKLKTRLVEIEVTGKQGPDERLPGARKEALHNNFSSRFFLKIGPTAAETCIVAAIGTYPPEVTSKGKGYFPCEAVNNSSPRFRASHPQAARMGDERAVTIRQQLLNNMPSCATISQETVRRDALNFLDWPRARGPLTQDTFWHLDYCARNGLPNPDYSF